MSTRAAADHIARTIIKNLAKQGRPHMTKPNAVFGLQAEDGIRDLTVTGVQTCALPICEDDKSGATLIERIEKAGHALSARAVVPDEIGKIRAQVERWIADPAIDVVITTGGTGFTVIGRAAWLGRG